MTLPREIAAVAGTNKLKVASTIAGLALLVQRGQNFADIDIVSDEIADCDYVPPQPFGLKQTRAGALYRAEAILAKVPAATYGVGIENGIILFDDHEPEEGGLDIPVVAVVRRGVRATYASGSGFQVEGRYVMGSKRTNQKTTCGKLIAAETGFNHANWHLDYAGKVTDRGETLVQAVFTAFALHFAGR